MTDREKVKTGIFEMLQRDTWRDIDKERHRFQPVLNNALTLLKEQDAKNVVNMTLSKDKFLIASCPKCNVLLTRIEHKNYCGYCGQAVKWE